MTTLTTPAAASAASKRAPVSDRSLAGARRERRLLAEAHGHLAAPAAERQGGRTDQDESAWDQEVHGLRRGSRAWRVGIATDVGSGLYGRAADL